jgi:hypothetical protein
MGKIWRWVRQTARLTHYLFNGRNQVEKYVLESTCDNDDGITQLQKVTAARLTYEEYPYIILKRTILERLEQQTAIRSIRKVLFLLDFIVRVGDICVRDDVIQMQPILEQLSCIKCFPVLTEEEILTEVCEFARDLIVLVNDDDTYDEARAQAGAVREQVRNLEIRLNPSVRRRCPPPIAVNVSPGRVQYDGITRSPQGNPEPVACVDDPVSESGELPNLHMQELD